MNMMDGPKFRRKHTSATRAGGRATEPSDPVPPLEEATEKARNESDDQIRKQVEARLKAEAEEEAERAAEAEAIKRAAAATKARRKAEFEEMARAEALRRVLKSREKRLTEAREAAERELAERAEREDAERAEREARERAEREAAERDEREARERTEQEAKERAEREAQERAEREKALKAAERRAKEALAEAERKKAAEDARLAEEQAAEQARQDDARRLAEAKHADAARLAAEQAAQEQRRREAERKADQERLSETRRRAEEEASQSARRAEEARRAETEAEPLPLTGMLPVTKPAAPAPKSAPADLAKIDIDSTWNGLADLTVNAAHLDCNRIITASREDPAHAAFDVLRTRLLQTLKENGWRRVAITSPGQGCGKTFTVANLAISLSRQENCRTLVMDLDMRRPRLHDALGIKKPGPLGDVLRGIVPPEEHLKRMGQNPVNAGRNIAFGLNDRVEKYPSELLQDPRTAAALESIEAKFSPDVMIFDLPPALFCDDVIALRPQYDGVLLVVGGGLTTDREIKEVERRLGESTPLLGMILNRAEGSELKRYGY